LDGTPWYVLSLEAIVDYFFLKKDYLKVLDRALAIKIKNPEAYDKVRLKVESILLSLIRLQLFSKIGLAKTMSIFEMFIQDFPRKPEYSEFLLNYIKKVVPLGMTSECLKVLEQYSRREDIDWSADQKYAIQKELLDLYISAGFLSKAKKLLENKVFKDDDQERNADIQLLKAKLFLAEEKEEEALKILESNNAYVALKMKLGIFWSRKKWPESIKTITKILDSYKESLEPERAERYVVQLAKALVLKEAGENNKSQSHRDTQQHLIKILSKYQVDLKKYVDLIKELAYLPYDSSEDQVSKKLLYNELLEVDRLRTLFEKTKAVPTY
jgi:hypothetical protein